MLKKLERYAIKIYLYLINLEVSITISTNSLPTTYQQLTDMLPAVGRLMVTTMEKSLGKLSTDSWPTVGRLLANCRPTVDRQSTDSRWGELFFTFTDLSEAIQHLTLQQSRDVFHKIFAKHPQEARTSFLEEVCGKHLTKEALLSLALELLWLTNRDSRVAAGNAIYMNLATEIGIDTNPADFVPLSLEAMRRLKDKGKPNLVYDFCACLGKDRPGTKQPLMPFDRMPFGMIEYNIEFFVCTNIHQVTTSLFFCHKRTQFL